MARYAFTDLHGQYRLWKQIKDYLKPEDTAYCLGDCIDRGPAGVNIFLEVIQDPRITLIKGNHEDIMSICIPEFVEGHFFDMDWWYGNGGQETWEFIDEMEQKIAGSAMYLFRQVQKLPTRIDITNDRGQEIILTHAGMSPWFDFEAYCQRGGKHRHGGIDELYIWDREHTLDKFVENGKYDNIYIVHGHTPTCLLDTDEHWARGEHYLLNHKAEIETYCSGHKFDLDLGSFFTHRVALFNLDTFEVIYFEDEEGLKEELGLVE